MGAFDLQGYESPEEVRRRIGKAQLAETMPKGDINQQIYQTAAQGGVNLGQGIERAFGLEQPAVSKARDMETALGGIDLSSSKSIYEAAAKLNSAGLTKQALMLTEKANEVRKLETAEAPKANELSRFKGVIGGKNVAAFSDKVGNVYARVDGQLVKNPKGLTELVTGTTENDPGALTKKTQGDLEKKLIDSKDLEARLEQIDAAYNAQSLTYGGAAQALYNKVLDKMDIDLSPEQADLLDKDTNMRQQVFDNMNTYIHDMSGAAVTVQEAARLAKALPTMADSPVEFRRKLANSKTNIRAAIDRYEAWREKGLIKRGMTDKQMATLTANSPPARAFSILKDARKAIASGKNKAMIIKELRKGFKADGYDMTLLEDL